MSKKILPMYDGIDIQINPLISIIMTRNMEGWLYERYVNLFMDERIVDYVDNVNYSGVISFFQKHDYDHAKENVIKIVKDSIDRSLYIIVWVDEYEVSCSYRYKKQHFVHPHVIYGYDDDIRNFEILFFDIQRGQVFRDIPYSELERAVYNVGQYYLEGGTESALTDTLYVFAPTNLIKHDFDLTIFSSQLRDYLCCNTNPLTEWYTLCRPHLFDSPNVTYGIQIYLRLIQILSEPAYNINLSYKTLHDFVLHKKYLLERFRYIQAKYAIGSRYDNLISEFNEHYLNLEKVRLLGIKRQVSKGERAVSFCCDEDYLEYLCSALLLGYETELELIPVILECLSSIKYPKNYFTDRNIRVLKKMDAVSEEGVLTWRFNDYQQFVNRIDIVRNNAIFVSGEDRLLINNRITYFLEADYQGRSPIRSIKCFPMRINKISLITEPEEFDYEIVLFSMNAYDDNHDVISLSLTHGWRGQNHCEVGNTDEGLTIKIVGEDPFLIHDAVNIDAEKFKYLHVEMSSSANTDVAQIYFSTINCPGMEQKRSVFFEIQGDASVHSYFVDMSTNYLWTGIVDSLRIDPAHYYDGHSWSFDGQECHITKIAFLKEIPVDASSAVLKWDSDKNRFIQV